MALTKKKLDSLRFTGRTKKSCCQYPDGPGGVPGFYVRVFATGRKKFVLSYRMPGSRRQQWFPIGDYGVWTLPQAREKAREILVAIASGLDPKRAAEAQQVTLEAFAPIFLQDMRTRGARSIGEMQRRIYKWFCYHPELSPHICPKCGKKQQQTLGPCNRGQSKQYPEGCDGKTEPVAKPTLGKLNLQDITTPKVAKLHQVVGTTATIEANRVLELLKLMFSKSQVLVEGMTDHKNPCVGIDKFDEEERATYLKTPALHRLREALEDEPLWLSNLVKLYLAIGLRKMELLALPWSAVTLSGSEGPHIDVSKTKSGRDLRLPLTPVVVDILKQMPSRMQSHWIFPSPVDPSTHRSDFRRHWNRIRDKAGLQEFTIHDLRRTCGSIMAQNGVPIMHIAEVLNHRSTAMTEVYARLHEDNRLAALEALSGPLSEVFSEFVA